MNAIRTAIVATLNSVAGIGLVHAYQRYAVMQDRFRTLYETGGQVLGWHIRRTGSRETPLTDAVNEIETDWEITGYLSLDDETGSELTMDSLVDAIATAFRLDDTLGGAVITCTGDNVAGIQLKRSEPVMFAGVLCHGVTLGLATWHQVEIPAPADEATMPSTVYGGYAPDIGADHEDDYVIIAEETP